MHLIIQGYRRDIQIDRETDSKTDREIKTQRQTVVRELERKTEVEKDQQISLKNRKFT